MSERTQTSDEKNRYVVIMAGGRGERFWPVSRQQTPKQLLTLWGGRSLLQQCYDRVAGLVPDERILVVTNGDQAAQVIAQLPQLPEENIVAEPCGRDTCAAVVLGAALVSQRSEAGVMAILPADHVISDPRRFREILADSMALAVTESVLVTVGIRPDQPATGYGYIKQGGRREVGDGRNDGRTIFFDAQRFVEKPDLSTAEAYVRSRQYVWNAGMFVWSAATLCEAIRQHQPEMSQAFVRWREAAAVPERLGTVLRGEYPGIQKISIDYALMEKAGNVVIADGDFGWDDLGAWTALSRHLPLDENGNCVIGDLVSVAAANNVVYDQRQRKNPVALVGINDSIVVMTDDATLVAAKSGAQNIKELVKRLAKDRLRRHLI